MGFNDVSCMHSVQEYHIARLGDVNLTDSNIFNYDNIKLLILIILSYIADTSITCMMQSSI